MKKIIRSLSLLISLTACCISPHANAQYHVIADKDNTHPELDRVSARRAVITSLSVREENNSNEVNWTAIQEEEVRKYIIEYTVNGRDFKTAGEMMANGKPYQLKHHFNYEQPLLYRIRAEQMNGKYFYSNPVPVIGGPTSLVEVYPTIITGNTINMNASLPVEKLIISTANGQQVFTKTLGGQRDFISLVIPQLSGGMYFVTFYGPGWKTTGKIIIR
jgi:hypothetical protein